MVGNGDEEEKRGFDISRLNVNSGTAHVNEKTRKQLTDMANEVMKTSDVSR